MDAFITSLIRTVAAAVGGGICSWLVSKGLDVGEAQGQLTLWFVLVGQGLYYGIVRYLEEKVWPKFGWLFLIPKAPDYKG